ALRAKSLVLHARLVRVQIPCYTPTCLLLLFGPGTPLTDICYYRDYSVRQETFLLELHPGLRGKKVVAEASTGHLPQMLEGMKVVQDLGFGRKVLAHLLPDPIRSVG